MKYRVVPTDPPLSKFPYASWLGYGAAAVVTALVVVQLFLLEKFIDGSSAFFYPYLGEVAAAIAPVVIACEFFALPMLLQLRLSVAFRWFSALMCVVVGCIWALSTYGASLLVAIGLVWVLMVYCQPRIKRL